MKRMLIGMIKFLQKIYLADEKGRNALIFLPVPSMEWKQSKNMAHLRAEFWHAGGF